MEAAFFDLDKTVIAKAAVVAFGGSLYREGLITRRLLLRGLCGQLVYLYVGADEEKVARMRNSLLALTKGWDQARIRSIVEEALEAVVEPIIYGEAIELIADHRAAGHLVVIVSASPEEIVAPLVRYLGADHAIASRAEVDANGRYTGRMAFDAFGPAKAEAMQTLALRHGIDIGASWAYSDSVSDLPMLRAVGHPVAVNPDRELLRTALDNGWEIRHFVRPVSLAGRATTGRRPGIPALVGATAVALVTGWWWRRRASRRIDMVLRPLPS